MNLGRMSFKIKRKTPPALSHSSPIKGTMVSPTHRDSRSPAPRSSSASEAPRAEVPSSVLFLHATQEELNLMQGMADAYHDPEVLDVRRQVNILVMIREFIVKEVKVRVLL